MYDRRVRRLLALPLLVLVLLAALPPNRAYASGAAEESYEYIAYMSSGEDVLAMQMKLKDLGYYRDDLTLNPEVFDEDTWYALQSFCQVNQITPDSGGASPSILRLLFSDTAQPYPAPSAPPVTEKQESDYEFIPFGAEGPQVLELQNRLKALSYYQDGLILTPSVYDGDTQSALELFCRTNMIAYDASGASPAVQHLLFSEGAQPYVAEKLSLGKRFGRYMTGSVSMFGAQIPTYLVWLYSLILIVLILVLVVHFFVPGREERKQDTQGEPGQQRYWRTSGALKTDSYVLTQGKIYGGMGQNLELQIHYEGAVRAVQCDCTAPLTIGRGKCDVVLDSGDRAASSSHCDIYLRGAVLMLRDHSTNGTYVNGRRLQNSECRLNSGDRLTIGSHTVDIQF